MKSFVQNTLAALVVAGAAAAPAAASVQSDVQQAISGGNINVSVNDAGVATLTGYTDSISRIAAERAARKNTDVSRVINLVEKS